MTDEFQIEFPLTAYFQTLLKELVETFSQTSGHSVKVKDITRMSLTALQDITPQMIDKASSRISESDQSGVSTNALYRKTTTLSAQDRHLLETIRRHLLINHKREFDRKTIMLAIIVTAHGLNISKITYILNEYK